MDQDQDIALKSMCDSQSKIVHAWKTKWLEAIFPEMVARPKWQAAFRNVQTGDIGHVRYVKKVGEHDWRLTMVEEAKPDEDGVV